MMEDKPNISVNVNTFAVREFFINFLIPLVCLVATGFLVIVILYPSYKALPELKVEASRKETLDNQLKAKLGVLNKLLDYKSVVDENLDLISAVLEAEAKVPQLLTQIDIIARESGLDVTKLSYSFGEQSIGRIDTGGQRGVDADAKVDLVFVSMSVTGNYDQMQNFYANLENSARLVDVDTFRFNLTEEGSNVLNISLVLRSPYLFVQSEAVTDDALRLDITDPEFIAMTDKVKGLRFYRISLENIEQAVIRQAEETVEEEVVMDDGTPSASQGEPLGESVTMSEDEVAE
jgi:Tfp pilus assembly protein PilO